MWERPPKLHTPLKSGAKGQRESTVAAESQAGMVTPELAGDLGVLFSDTCMAPAPTGISPVSQGLWEHERGVFLPCLSCQQYLAHSWRLCLPMSSVNSDAPCNLQCGSVKRG